MANIIHPDIDPSEKYHEKTSRYIGIIERVAEKHSLPFIAVERILEAQFRTIRDVMRIGEFLSIRLPRLGLFRAKQTRIVRYFEDLGYNHQSKRIGKENEPPQLIHRLAIKGITKMDRTNQLRKSKWKRKNNGSI